ncbi:hypothetical protein HAX54_049573 [Datura stramonium]|uniref:Uncharacterized protein n=1 Tax=Datura stramonium TaxID=4076 RepID=A0ABS8SVV9_DATST|nr:hypothetical protein [Datura stramonium]
MVMKMLEGSVVETQICWQPCNQNALGLAEPYGFFDVTEATEIARFLKRYMHFCSSRALLLSSTPKPRPKPTDFPICRK